MKELSVEQKAKRYDEAIKRAKELLEIGAKDTRDKRVVLSFFPELKESEDDRIRKELADYIKRKFENSCSPTPSKKILTNWIAWLEKQSNKRDIHLLELKAKAYDDARERMSYAYNQNRVPIGFISEIFPNLNSYENQDELKNIDSDDLATLEIWKDAIKENKEKWQLSDWFVEATSLLIQKVKRIENNESINIKDSRVMLNACINVLRTAGHSHLSNWLEKQGEQKSADKVEPKFNLYDWVVTDKGDTVQIGAVNNGYYTLCNGMDFNMSYVDKCWHKWTIEDAKDGDVLVASDNSIFIFARVDGYGCVHHIALASDGTLKINPRLISAWESVKGVKPATKEQHDLLFQKMKEEGYEWNKDKKELIKL